MCEAFIVYSVVKRLQSSGDDALNSPTRMPLSGPQAAPVPPPAVSAPLSSPPLVIRGRVGLPSGGKVLTPSFIALVGYCWLIHSYKLPGVGLWIGAALITALLQPGKPRFPAPLLWFGAFVLWAFVGGLGSDYPAIVSKHLGDFVKIWLVFFAACNALRSPNQIRAFIICYLAIFALYPLRGLLMNVAGGYSHNGRYAWNFIFSNPNDFATLTFLVFGLNMVAFQSATATWQRRAALLGAILMPVAILFTGSRAGFLGLVLFGVLILLRSRQKVRMMSLGIVAAVAVAIAAPPAAWDRVRSLTKVRDTQELQSEGDESARQRYMIWQIAWQMWKDHPVFGVGLGAAPQSNLVYALNRPEWTLARARWNTHNTFLNVLAETGLPGFIFFAGMFASVFRQMGKSRRAVEPLVPEWGTDVRYLEAGLIAFMLGATFGVIHGIPYLYIYLAVCWLLASAFLNAVAQAPAPPRHAGHASRA